uniref:Uncharacterized protein n=1 Tax=Rhizophora mucronata TaxID=61149 RepID=A0A2P2R447_RHIMU
MSSSTKGWTKFFLGASFLTTMM